jgi:L-ascorbate metabolism protein UlaG (beta-lactamase superfamily)
VLDAIGGGNGFEDAPAERTAALAALDREDLGAVWLGHASVLARVGETRVLLDPVLSGRIGPRLAGRTVGLGRLSPAPLSPAQVPEAGLVLLSHAHFDHLDVPTLAALRSPGAVVVTARGTSALVPAGFAGIIELGWGESVRVGGVEVTALRPRHWGARTALDRARGFNAYLVRSLGGRGRSLFFGGDTAATDAFKGVHADLAVMGVGGYRPWEHAHATPEQAWAMFRAMRAERLLPVHHSTFRLSDEPAGEPMERLLRAAEREEDRVIVATPGAVWTR